MSLSLAKIGGASALLACALMIAGIPALLFFYLKNPVPLGQSLSQTLSNVDASSVNYWMALHLFQALFLLLAIPALWSSTASLKSSDESLSTWALVAGVTALVSAALLMMWKGSVEVVMMKAYLSSLQQGTPPDALVALSQRLDVVSTTLKSVSLLIILWAILFAVGVVRSGAFPSWMGILGLFMIPAVGPFTPAGLVWLLPSGPLLMRGNGSHAPKNGAAHRASGRKRSAGRWRQPTESGDIESP
ncbi:MAG: DUF4386 family protein [Chloroflexi bacterium]|nr:DUF4386 family protein [Chloroflexota bacterium]